MSAASQADGKHTHTQEERVLWVLQSAWPNWVPAIALSNISLQYNARIFSLRRKGWQIANRTETINGQKHGSFRLGSPPKTSPSQRPKPTPQPSGGLLFELPPQIHRDDG